MFSFLGADPIFRLQDHINIYHLEQLMNTFHLAGTGLQGYDIAARTGTMDEAVMRRGYLTLMEFRQALVEILGPAVDKEQMEMLFMKVGNISALSVHSSVCLSVCLSVCFFI